ncbi:MAG: hypothetical protein QM530_10650 [Phycisphaerales bacterium]|nr:hypothetical protein [Phycisphaerales bacterium]
MYSFTTLLMAYSSPCGVVKGKHPALISQEAFLRLNEIRANSGTKFVVYHQKERDEIPLKVFTKCERCGVAYTGYLVKDKGIYYYKCWTVGCRSNQNAIRMNEHFPDFISSYAIKP